MRTSLVILSSIAFCVALIAFLFWVYLAGISFERTSGNFRGFEIGEGRASVLQNIEKMDRIQQVTMLLESGAQVVAAPFGDNGWSLDGIENFDSLSELGDFLECSVVRRTGEGEYFFAGSTERFELFFAGSELVRIRYVRFFVGI